MAGSPYSQEAEEAVIGSILIRPSTFLTIASFLKPEDFYFQRNQAIWQAMMRLHERKEPIDTITLANELNGMDQLELVGGESKLTRLIADTPTSVHAEVYGRLVERAAIRRRLMEAADEIRSLAVDESLAIDAVTSQAETRLFNVTDRQLRREFISMNDAVNDYFDQIELRMQMKEGAMGIPSGFSDLDALLGGFQRSDLLIFAGRPGMGKCVTGETLVTTEQGLVPIASLKPSGAIGVPDDDGGVYYPLVRRVQTPKGVQPTSHFYESGPRQTLRLETSAGFTLTGTYNHAVMVLDGDGGKVWRPLMALRPGDQVAVRPDATLHWDEVTQVEPAGERLCYDLTVPSEQSFITNGIVSHNTSFLLSSAVNSARLGARVAIFTMEMGVDQLVQRMVAMETGLSAQKLRLGKLNDAEFSRFVEAAGRIARFPIFIDDTPALNPLQMRTKSRRLMHEHGLDMIIVDYMQLMNAGGQYQNNRVQEISFISRALKELARELNVPVFSAAQLSRAVEQRQDKRPVLSDLRESGCVTGESRVYLYDEGHDEEIRNLIGKTGFRVLSLNTETYTLEPGMVTNSFSTGVQPVYKLTTRLGRTIRATANHKFFTVNGWKRLDALTTDDHIALPRTIEGPTEQTMPDAELALLGHLIGDGCTLPRHAIQYTTVEEDLAQTVADLATRIFGDTITPRIVKEKGRNWYQVFLSASERLTHGKHNPITTWLTDLGVFGLRSHEKRVPTKVFQQPKAAIALFLRHLWSTDGCIRMRKTTNGFYPAVYYASSSPVLTEHVVSLLLRLGISARMKPVSQKNKGRDQYHVIVTGIPDLSMFVNAIGTVGGIKAEGLKKVRNYTDTHKANTNRDIIPRDIWHIHVKPAMKSEQISGRQLQNALGMSYCGTAIYKQNVSRDRARRVAEIVDSDELMNLAISDVYWDRVVSVEPDGEEEVFDLTVEPHHSYVCNNFTIKNSIEQDADIVMFLYRDAVYNEATEFPNQADIIVAKHRNGPTGTISLYFESALTKFIDGAVRHVDLGDM